MEYGAEISIGLRRNMKESLAVALSKLSGFLDVNSSSSQVIIKPSIYDPNLVGNTNPDLIRNIIHTFSNLGQISIVESDNPLRTAADAFGKLGYDTLCTHNVKLVNLSEATKESVHMPGHHFNNLEMASFLSEPNFFVNVPTLKIEPNICTVGGGIKNLFGLIPETDKRQYHPHIDEVLLDLLSIFRPHLTIMDLTNLVIGDREDGNIRKIGAVIVGTDPVAVDAFCSDLLGIDPMKVSHLKKAYELGLGEIIIDRIRINGTEEQKKRLFELCTL